MKSRRSWLTENVEVIVRKWLAIQTDALNLLSGRTLTANMTSRLGQQTVGVKCFTVVLRGGGEQEGGSWRKGSGENVRIYRKACGSLRCLMGEEVKGCFLCNSVSLIVSQFRRRDICPSKLPDVGGGELGSGCFLHVPGASLALRWGNQEEVPENTDNGVHWRLYMRADAGHSSVQLYQATSTPSCPF